jgi:uncharacterized protein YciI
MNYYFYKLNSPRTTFPADMTPEERILMQQHVAYWTDQMMKGKVVAIGPVADPKGTFGVAILRLTDGSDSDALVAADPVIRANVGFTTEIYSMPRVLVAAAG